MGLGWTVTVEASLIGIALGLSALAVGIWTPQGESATRRRRAIEAAAHRFLDLWVLIWFQVRRVLYQNFALAGVVANRGLAPGGRLVDLGCGHKELLSLAKEMMAGHPPASFAGITSSPQSAARVRQVLQPSVEVAVGDPAGWNFGSAGAVVIREAQRRDAPHIDETFLRRIRAALNPGGFLVIAWTGRRVSGAVNAALKEGLPCLMRSGFSIADQQSRYSRVHPRVAVLARV